MIEAPQCGQMSGALGVAVGFIFVLLLSFGIDRYVFGGAEDCFQFSEDHYDQAGRMFGEQVGDDLAGDLLCLLCAHGGNRGRRR